MTRKRNGESGNPSCNPLEDLKNLDALEEISTQNGPPKENNKIIVKIIN